MSELILILLRLSDQQYEIKQNFWSFPYFELSEICFQLAAYLQNY